MNAYTDSIISGVGDSLLKNSMEILHTRLHVDRKSISAIIMVNTNTTTCSCRMFNSQVDLPHLAE